MNRKPFSVAVVAGTIAIFVGFIEAGCHSKNGSGEKVSPVFKKILAEKSGITFDNLVGENYQKNYFDKFAYVYNGGGVAIGDINNDGLMDIYFTGNEVPNKLYLNEGGMKFRDITESAGVDGGQGWDNGVTMADVNGDGLTDIYVCKGGFDDSDDERRNLLYINQGDLTFKEEAKEYGLDDNGYSMHAVFFDMDNDNDLDVYITSRPDTFYLGLSQMVAGKRNPPDKCRDKLYRNDNGKFVEIGKQAGINPNYGYALSVVAADLNNDGYQDIFVANDYADNDYLYINQRDGTFKDEVKKATHHLSLSSMGTDIADINNDGLEDILVMDMLPEDYKRSKISVPSVTQESFWAAIDSGFHKQYMHNVLHLNQGNMFFSEVSQLAGIDKTEWSWAPLAADFDNDGDRDIFVSNGYRRDIFDGDIQRKLETYMNANRTKYSSAEDFFQRGFKGFIELYDPIKVRNYLFKNDGDLKFENVSEAWGFTENSFSNGAAIADLDNDGDLDLVVNNLDEEAFLYENTTDKKNDYIKIKLKGPAKNEDGIGAGVTIYYDGKKQFFEQKTVRGYLSSNEPSVHFGLGKAAKIDSIKVEWPGGTESVLKDIKTDEVVTVNYADARKENKQPAVNDIPFTEATNTLFTQPFVHKENIYNEYKDQTLLPHGFSMTGPFIATGDVNKDGTEDFYIGGAAGQAGALYLQKNGKLEKQNIPVFDKDKAFEDMGCSFFDADNDGDLDLYVVSGGSEFPDGSSMYQDRLYSNDGKGNFTKSKLPVTSSSGSCVVPLDIDGDGDLDVFRGGQVVPHQYPYAPRSYVFINEKGTFTDKTIEIAPDLVKPGMVNSAVWADLDGDNKAELVIAGEWMPVKVFKYINGKLSDASAGFGLAGTEGWWNKLVADDIDGDGDMDLIAGNLGENYRFHASKEKPFEVYAKDFDHNGTNDIFLAEHLNNDVLEPVHGLECIGRQCPMIGQKFSTYLSFAESDLKGILGNDMETALHYKAYLFSSVIFVNDNGKFTIKKLPVQAQFSTANSILVHDFDGDGKKDILVAGNMFDVNVETTPADASPGIFLKGSGNFVFKSYKPLESGFFTPYNVKDMKAIKTNNGWAILVSSNNDTLRTFTNSEK